ncbi:MAG: carboxypeptidase regulatory-like domain-containing protein [Gemmatimonadales bacterium]
MPFRSFATTVVAALLAAAASALAQGGEGGLLTGVVVSSAGQAPLGHSMVSLQPAGRQTFTDDLGRFAFRGVPPGRHRLRVTHLGFAPLEIPVTLAPDSAPTRVRVALTEVQVRLATVQVTADAPCVAPGAPDPAREREFFVIFQQLEQNAQEYRLLADSFPYAYHEERTNYSVRGDSVLESMRTDTALLRSDKPGWTYRPGRVISTDFITRQRSMHLPTLSDFAGEEFVRNHCFRYGGSVHTPDGDAVRIEFRAADRIGSPDVNGSILLDATTYQIRRADLRLSQVPAALRRVAAVNVTTLFREVEPSVLVFSEVHGVSTMIPSKDLLDRIESVEDHVLLDFGFLRVDPRRGAQKP